MEVSQMVRALGALAHEAWLAVFGLLVEAGRDGLPAGVIADSLAISPSALRFHLKELTHCGPLVQRPHGRRIQYSAHFGAMNGLVAYLTDNCCGASACELADSPPVAHCC